MQKFKTLVLSLVLLIPTACIDAAPRGAVSRDTSPKISHSQSVINSYIGERVSELIRHLGAPTKSLHISGKEYIVYVREGTRSGGSQRYGSAYSYSYVGCTWTWEIFRGTIVGGTANGPECNDRR